MHQKSLKFLNVLNRCSICKEGAGRCTAIQYQCLSRLQFKIVFCLPFTAGICSQISLTLQDGLTGSAWGDWANYTASPLRAFENELGVQAPVGFWDPVGFTADGDVAAFKRRRSVELKHGRISMMATMGALDRMFMLLCYS